MLLPYDMWQMVNHRGRCFNLLLSKVADNAIMFCVADGKQTKLHVTTFVNFLMADVIAKVADGIATYGQISFNFSSEVLNRTSSPMCGRWYLPMFLLGMDC